MAQGQFIPGLSFSILGLNISPFALLFSSFQGKQYCQRATAPSLGKKSFFYDLRLAKIFWETDIRAQFLKHLSLRDNNRDSSLNFCSFCHSPSPNFFAWKSCEKSWVNGEMLKCSAQKLRNWALDCSSLCAFCFPKTGKPTFWLLFLYEEVELQEHFLRSIPSAEKANKKLGAGYNCWTQFLRNWPLV